MASLKDARSLADMAKELGRVGCYAPGNYIHQCSACERTFMGDKRAFLCLPCAIDSLHRCIMSLRRSLAFYANPSLWDELGNPQIDAGSAPILRDKGSRARAAIRSLRAIGEAIEADEVSDRQT